MWQYNYDYLQHHGILGQKWGVRRFQNADGSLTSAGKRRYSAESVGNISSEKGTKKRSQVKSAEQKKQQLENAKKNNEWYIDFLEAIQNTKIMYERDTKSMLEEYSKYLDDPEDYWKNQRHKLEQE